MGTNTAWAATIDAAKTGSYSIEQAAFLLNETETYVRKLCRDGKAFECIKVFGVWFIEPASLDALVAHKAAEIAMRERKTELRKEYADKLEALNRELGAKAE
jgi:hypothetical protein